MNFVPDAIRSFCSAHATLKRWFAGGVLTLLILFSAAIGNAQPSGANVISGAASVTYHGGNTTVTAGNNSVLRWNSFDVASSQTVQFIQPSVDSKVLNWIGGSTPSQIDGTIRANGQVYLVNPAGLFFGRTAVIDAARLYAVAGSLSKEDFFSGNDRFTQLSGAVRNEGSLHASTVALIGRTVANSGTIVSPNGFVALAAGEQVLLGRKGSSIFVDTGTSASPAATPISSAPGVANAGKIDAGQGSVALAAGDLYSIAISHTGQLRGRDVRVQGKGRGDVLIDGTIDVSSARKGGVGGYVEVTGERVSLLGGASIDASGAAGGGTILVGGDTHGATAAVRNAESTLVAKTAALKADAMHGGNGGKIIVWSNGYTGYAGGLSAKGGALFGNGGFAEVSGKQLTFAGSSNLSAASGHAGSLLLDPANITINNGPDGPLDFFDPRTYKPSVNDSTISWATLLGSLASGNVEVSTSNTGGNQLGNITIAESPLAGTYNTPSSLTLTTAAAGGIIINSPVVNAGVGDFNLLPGSGGVTLGGVAGVTILGTRGSINIGSLQQEAGTVAGLGTLRADTGIAFRIRDTSQLGTVLSPIATAASQITIKSPQSYLKNSSDQVLNITLQPGSTSLDLVAKDGVGAADASIELSLPNALKLSALRVWGSNIDITGRPDFTSSFTVGNSGTLEVPNGFTADTLTLENSGAVDLGANVPNVFINKSGGGVRITDPQDIVTVSGQSTDRIELAAGAGFGRFVIGAPSLSGTEIQFHGGVSGPGTVTATKILNLADQNSVGQLGAPLLITTPALGVSKLGGNNNVYVSNASDIGLTIEGPTGGIMSVTSLDGLRQAPAPIISRSGNNGIGGATGGAIILNSSTLTVAGKIEGTTVSVNHTGAITGNGTITAPGGITFTGTGNVGTVTNSIATNTPTVTIEQPSGGALFLNNGTSNLGLDFTGFTGGGSFRGGDVTILSRTSLNVGANPLSFSSSRTIDLGFLPITAGTLTLAHDGALLGYTPPQVGTLVLGGAGDDGSAGESFLTAVPTLILQKTGTAQVFLENARDLGLTLSGTSNSTVMISSENANREPVVAAPLSIGASGLRSGGATTLSSSTLALGGGVTGSTLTLNTTGPINGPGILTAATQLNLNGTGDVGTFAAPVVSRTPLLVLNQPAGAVYLNNGSGALTLTPTAFTGGGAFWSGDLVLNLPVDVGSSNNLSFISSGSLLLGANAIRANTLTLSHDGAINGSPAGGLAVNTLILGGAGDDGSASNPFAIATPNLVLSKTGSASVYLDNRADLGFTVAGSTPSLLSVHSLDTSGAAPAGLVIGSAGLTTGGSLALNSSTLSLQGVTSSPSIQFTTTGQISGPGLVRASTQLVLLGSGEVGTNTASISTATPAVTVNKPAGSVFLDNGTADLALTPTAFAAGGAFAAGNLTLLGSIAAGANPVTFTASRSLNLGAYDIRGGNVTFDHAGDLTGSGTVSATQLSLAGAGGVGTAGAPLLIQTQSLSVNKSAGAIYLNDGALDLALTPISFLGGGVLRSGSLSLLGTLNSGEAGFSFFTAGAIDLKSNAISAAQLTLNHGGSLSNPGNINVGTLTLGGAGDDGSSTAHLVISTPSLLLNKTGQGNVYVDNRRDPGLAVEGSAFSVVNVRSRNTAGTDFAPLTIGTGKLITNGAATSTLTTVAGDPARGTQSDVLANSSVVLEAQTVTLAGDIHTANLTISHSGGMSGAGLLQADSTLTLGSIGDVGRADAPILADTPEIELNKSAGAVFIINQGASLSLKPTAFAGGGAITSGNFVLRGDVDVGQNSFAVTSPGTIDLGAFTVTAGTVTFNNGALLSGSKVVTATQLDLGGNGVVGSITAPLLYSGGPKDVILVGRSKDGVNVGFFGRAATVLPDVLAGSVAGVLNGSAGSQRDEPAGSPDSDDASSPGRNSRRGAGAAFRAISAKADLASATREQLQALGVYARPLRPEERLSRERKEAVFVTVPERERPKESDFEVVDARIDPTAIRDVLHFAAETGLIEPGKSRLTEVARSLSLTFTAFSTAFPAGDAARFRTWLETRNDADAVLVLKFLDSLRSTIAKIERLGLTHQEILVSKAQIFGSILGIQLNTDPDFLRALVENAPPSTTASLDQPAGGKRLALR